MQKENDVIATNAPDSLKMLWLKKYFISWRKFRQIVTKLSEMGYNFSLQEFGMALKRAKYLMRRGNRMNYEYIQKFPYVKNEK